MKGQTGLVRWKSPARYHLRAQGLKKSLNLKISAVRRGCNMTEASKQWVGQIVEGTFPLRQYLGGSDHSAVFLTERHEGEPRKAALKLVPADEGTADLQLSSWNVAAQLSHPNLLRLYRTGRCKVGGKDLLYLVMEYAEEDLADILPQRALTPEETRDMLCPVLDALEYLHGKGFVHGDLKPANVLATGDQLKLSSDRISRIGESRGPARRTGAYDPPEAISGKLTPAADVWSLGTTLVEVMTQHLPDWEPGGQREPAIPADLPAPYQEIARQCLRLEPQRRASIVEIAARLNSRAVAAAASSSISPMASAAAAIPNLQAATGPALPTRSEPSAPVTQPPRAAARLQSAPHRPPPYKVPGTKPRFIIPLAVGAVIFAVVLTVPRLLTQRPPSRSARAVTPQEPANQPVAENTAAAAVAPKPNSTPENASSTPEAIKPAAQREAQGAAQLSATRDLKTTSEKDKQLVSAAPRPSSSSVNSAGTAAGSGVVANGEVLDQILPDVSQKSLATIHGSVRVGIKVRVDSTGAVSDAELDSPGPSKYFADAALSAARKWVFTPPEAEGKSVASEWNLHFVFTQGGVKVTPAQTAP